jgi:hypothetical protein
LESHLTHSDPQAVPGYIKFELLEKLGLIFHKLKCKRDLELNTEMTGTDNKLVIQTLLSDIETDLELLPPLDYFQDLPKSCDDDVFFEALLSKVKTEVLAEQQKIYNIINAKKSRLCKRLSELKKNYVVNTDEIFRLEQELTDHTESLLRAQVEEMGLFQRLNNEKNYAVFALH